MSDHKALIERLLGNATSLELLTRYSEDAVWRPADRAVKSLREAAYALERASGGVPSREEVAKVIHDRRFEPWTVDSANEMADQILSLLPLGGVGVGGDGSASADLSRASSSPSQHSAGWWVARRFKEELLKLCEATEEECGNPSGNVVEQSYARGRRIEAKATRRTMAMVFSELVLESDDLLGAQRFDDEAVWRVCSVITGDCKRCPDSEMIGGDECQRGCRLQATECINTVETGNPWRKTDDVRAPWVALGGENV